MIRNLIILDRNGRALLSANFGECHSFGDNDEVFSSFVSAILSFCKEALSADSVSEIQLGTLSFMLTSQDDLIFSISADDSATEANRAILWRIADMFTSRYGSVLPDGEDEIDTASFKSFAQYLVKEGVLKPNCGKFEECIGCENRQKQLPLPEMTEILRQH